MDVMKVNRRDEQEASLCHHAIFELLRIQEEDMMKQMKYYMYGEKRNSFKTTLISEGFIKRF